MPATDYTQQELTNMLSMMSSLLPFIDYTVGNSKPFEDAFRVARDRAVELANEFVAQVPKANT